MNGERSKSYREPIEKLSRTDRRIPHLYRARIGSVSTSYRVRIDPVLISYRTRIKYVSSTYQVRIVLVSSLYLPSFYLRLTIREWYKNDRKSIRDQYVFHRRNNEGVLNVECWMLPVNALYPGRCPGLWRYSPFMACWYNLILNTPIRVIRWRSLSVHLWNLYTTRMLCWQFRDISEIRGSLIQNSTLNNSKLNIE